MSVEYDEQPYYIPRTLIIGKEGVGISSFINSLKIPATKIFDSNTKLTIGVDLYTYDYTLKSSSNNKLIRFQIFAFNPESRFKEISSNYFLGSNAIIIMFDVSDLTSLNKISEWMEVIKKKCVNNLPILLLGNKSDLKEYLKRAKHLAESIVEKYQLLGYYEVSSLKSKNTDIIFDIITKAYLQKFIPNP